MNEASSPAATANQTGAISALAEMKQPSRPDGTWLYRGMPIHRKELVCLFMSVLRREADGSFWLETPTERGRIDVEDAPFLAVELDWGGDGRPGADDLGMEALELRLGGGR